MTISRNPRLAIPLEIDDVTRRIESLINELGSGVDLNSDAYDTAWIARLQATHPGNGFERAVEWIRRSQWPDGSWGASVLHYHDRVISTLSAVVALRRLGHSTDVERIRRGEMALWQLCGKLRHDAQDTIGFPLLSVSLTDEALRLGCDVPVNMWQPSEGIRKKLAALARSPDALLRSPVAFSFEALGPIDVYDARWLEPNGTIAASPAATASFVERTNNETAVDSLRRILARQPDGGVPYISPIDTVEIEWALNHLRLVGAISPDLPAVRAHLEFLQRYWKPAEGIAGSSCFKVADSDDTAVAFLVLNWGGSPVSADVFARYESTEHFATYIGEADPSASANVHILSALRDVGEHPRAAAWIEKIRNMLIRHRGSNPLWFDKWHISPYYITCDAIAALCGLDDELIAPSIQWILRTQREDGGWGFHDRSTAEETAYALEALLLWTRAKSPVDPGKLAAAARYLCDHVDDEQLPELWVGKGLYAPLRVVRAAILAALYGYLTQ